MTKDSIKHSIVKHLAQSLAKDPERATRRDWWMATCYTIRDQIMETFIECQKAQREKNVKRVYYFSLEYLIGRLLNTNVDNLNLKKPLLQALKELGQNYEDLRQEEVDMGLGNGGLGRLAVCFMDSLATLQYPAVGYGILYEFGLFKQKILNHRQEECPDHWLRFGNPWRVLRAEYTQAIPLYGRVEKHFDDRGNASSRWIDTKTILGVPWDIPIVGYMGKTINFLRLWESRASEDFDLKVFNEGGYIEAVREKAEGESISKVLYPNDKTQNGKELRLVQQYFFVSCSLQDIIRRFKEHNRDFSNFQDKAVIQLNDTHPAIAIPEFMRLLMDQEGFSWDDAWKLCRKVFAYTNHTLLPEALERWSVPLMQKVLPRHLEIIYEINHWFLTQEVDKKWPNDDAKKRALSIIEEGSPQYVRMSYLSVIASFSVNGVARLHTELLKTRLFPDFHVLYPGKFNNKTNGVTPRRWLKSVNPRLSQLITDKIGSDWLVDLDQLRKLEDFSDDPQFLKVYRQIKLENKKDLAKYIEETCHVKVDPTALFDVQIKRLHEYKRQHLNLLHIMQLYYELLQGRKMPVKRVVIFGAKAAPEYHLAKEIIHSINLLGEKINNDPRLNDALKVVFLPNYNITLAGKIIPAADLSEQISTAGKEASGTGNMKLGLNGACTLGTLDGANVEMLECVGDDNMFIFGHTVEEIEKLRQKGYRPQDYYESDLRLKHILDWMRSDAFLDQGHNPMKVVCQSLLEGGDPFFVLADFDDYYKKQRKVEEIYQQPDLWAKKALFNTARLGYFSSDRTIQDYVHDIWHLRN